MATLAERLAELGVKLGAHPHGLTHLNVGKQYVTCPQCSKDRKPENQKKPCLTVEIDNKGAKLTCHHCDWHTAFYADGRRRDGDYEPAARPLPKPARQPPKQLTPSDAMVRWFKEKRGISAATLQRLGIYLGKGWFPQVQQALPALVFPYRVDGEVVNNKYRSDTKMFAMDAGARMCLYNEDAIAGAETLVWCEGEIDVAAVIESGIDHVTSLPAGAPKDHKAEIDRDDKRFLPFVNAAEKIAPVKRHILATDGDGPGDNLAYQLAHRIGVERCFRVIFPDGCKDLDEVLVKHGPAAVKKCIAEARGYPIEGIVELQPGDLIRYRNSPALASYAAGVPDLDKLLRFRPGQLVIVSGWPGSGKSEIVDWLAVRLASAHGWKWGFCSLEKDDTSRHFAQLVEKHLGEPFQKYSPNVQEMTDSRLQAGEAWVRRHFFLAKRARTEKLPTVPWILDKFRAMHLRYGLNAGVIDPYNRVAHDRRGMTEIDYVPVFLQQLIDFAVNHSMVMFLVAHPRKLGRDKSGKQMVPTLEDISGSMAFWAFADIGLVAQRVSFENREVDLMVQKMRMKDQGRAGSVRLIWAKDTGIYTVAPPKERNVSDAQMAPDYEPQYEEQQDEIPF